MMKEYHMKWSEYEVNMKDTFKKLRDNAALFDVTLATEDGQDIKAHKIVLASGSEFFSDIFMSRSNTNLLVYMKGIRNVDLAKIIDFIYTGHQNGHLDGHLNGHLSGY